jgi:hypothetical protein
MIPLTVLRRLDCAPAIPEQEAIGKHLDTEAHRTDGLAAKIETPIARPTEYRTVLNQKSLHGLSGGPAGGAAAVQIHFGGEIKEPFRGYR